MLDAADAHNFQAFLVPQATSSGSEDSDRQSTNWESADEESDHSLDQLYAQSLNGVTVKQELPTDYGSDSKDSSTKREASERKHEDGDDLEMSDESGTDTSLSMMVSRELYFYSLLFLFLLTFPPLLFLYFHFHFVQLYYIIGLSNKTHLFRHMLVTLSLRDLVKMFYTQIIRELTIFSAGFTVWLLHNPTCSHYVYVGVCTNYV